MSNIFSGILGSIAFGALLISGIVEIILSAKWHKLYFTIGVPVFVIYVPVNARHSNIPSCALFEQNFKSGCLNWTGALLFKEIDINTIGFRESLLQFRKSTPLHGLLIFDEQNNQVIVKGLFDWWFLCFVLIWLIIPPLLWLLGYISFYEPTWLVALAYFGVLFANIVIFYLIDYFRFSKVAKFAADAWSRKYVFSTVAG